MGLSAEFVQRVESALKVPRIRPFRPPSQPFMPLKPSRGPGKEANQDSLESTARGRQLKSLDYIARQTLIRYYPVSRSAKRTNDHAQFCGIPAKKGISGAPENQLNGYLRGEAATYRQVRHLITVLYQ